MIERKVLSRWWAFPLVGILLSYALSKWFWFFVTLDPADISEGWLNPFKSAYLLVVAGMSFIPLIWQLLRRMEQVRPFIQRLPIATMTAVLMLLLFDAVVRNARVQIPFWLAVRARTGEGDYFMRELTYMRLHQRAPEEWHSGSCVYLVGSSQVLVGIDEKRLAELIHPVPVKRRAMYGMTPLKALAALSYLDVKPGDKVVFYLSEFDFTNQLEMPVNWMRPLSGPGTLGMISRCFRPLRLLRYWRQLVDLGTASVSEAWRMRDYVKHLVFHVAEGSQSMAATLLVNMDGGAVMAKPDESLRFMPAEFAAFKRLVEELNARGANGIVFEGQVSPELHTDQRSAFRGETELRMRQLAGEVGFAYVPLDKQAFKAGAGDWKDMTHLSDEGRRKFTEYIADFLNQEMKSKQESDERN